MLLTTKSGPDFEFEFVRALWNLECAIQMFGKIILPFQNLVIIRGQCYSLNVAMNEEI